MSNHFKTIREINKPLQTAGRDDRELVLEAIEALKRWIYREGYQGPEKEPVPMAEGDFSLLMDGLRRWATLHAPHTDTGRLQDYRREELGLPSACGSTRVFADLSAEREWRQAAAKADDALNELRILLLEHSAKKRPKTRMSQTEANQKGLELAKQLGQAFFQLSGREQARRIGCAWKTWERTELYKSAKQRKAKTLPKHRAGSRRPVSFTHDLESVTGQGTRDEVLNQLIAEQEADDEPSPIDDSVARKIHSRKRL